MRDTKLVAAKLIAALEQDKREANRAYFAERKAHFAERIEDKQRKRKLLAELQQVLRGKL